LNDNRDREPRSGPQSVGEPTTPSLGDRARSKASAFEPLLGSLLSRSEVARFFQLVREDLEAHDGDWTRPGFQALLVYRFGVWRMSIPWRLGRAPFSVLWRTLFAAVRNVYGIELPFSASIGRRVVFEHQHGIVVHGNTVIGDDCVIRQGVTLGIRRLDRLTDAPVLGRGVNVGAGAKILGHVMIGDHAEIGANAVVLHDVPPHTLAVGVPAHHVHGVKVEPATSSDAALNGASPTGVLAGSSAPNGSAPSPFTRARSS
jgi:serine O-acetyltransferase